MQYIEDLKEVLNSERPLTERDHVILEFSIERFEELASSGLDSLIAHSVARLEAIEARIQKSIDLKIAGGLK